MRRSRKKIAAKRGKDWINQLDDSMLIHILSFLSTKEAVQTCLVAKRWTKLWTHVPSLTFDFADFIPPSASSYDQVHYYSDIFQNFIASVLNLRQAPLSRGFRLVCLYDTSYGIDPSFDWIPQVMNLKPQALNLAVQTSLHSLPLPACLFNSHSLQELELKISTDRGVLFDSELINLPCLKRLYLSFVKIDSHVMVNLLSGCAKLEELKLEYCTLSFSELISGTLKRLVVCGCVIKRHICFSIPSLLDLRISVDYLKNKVSFKDMASLRKASVYFNSGNAEILGGTHNKLFPGLANVASLDFKLCRSNYADKTNMMIMLQHALEQCPTFNNLHTFTVAGPLIPVVHLITHFIQHMPNLHKLAINHDENSTSKEFCRYDPVECEHLRLVEIMYKKQHNHVNKLVEALRAHVKSIGEIRMGILKD